MRNMLFSALLLAVLMSFGIAARGQDTPPEDPGGPPRDPITQLRLTPEQRQRIRQIREQNKDLRSTVNDRMRESNIALEQALDADNPNEAEIEQKLKEL